MPPPVILDPTTLDFEHPIADRAAIERVNPHRFEFALLDGVLLIDAEKGLLAGYHDVRTDAYWVRGHIPGRPLMPGVVQIEAGAQLLSFFVTQIYEEHGFIGFGGIERAKFRATVEPGCRLHLLGHLTEIRRGRKYTCDVQGIVAQTLVFEATIFGLRV